MPDGNEGKGRIKTLALTALFWLPLLSGVLSRAFKLSKWFGDYGAIACAAEKHLIGEPIYDRALECADVHNVVYVYHPIIAETFAWLLERLGQSGLLMAYAGVFAAAVAALIWIAIGRTGRGPRSKRAWFAAFITGSAIYWGNIAVILHALLGVFALTLRRRPSLLVLAIAVAVVVKPLFAGFAVVFLLMRRRLFARALYALAAVALGAAPSVWTLWQGGELAVQWRALIEYYVYIDRPGEAYLGWMSAIGAPVASLGVSIGYLAFAGAMALAGIVLAEGLELDDEARVLLGLSLGVLLIPRLMAQDYWLLGPGLLALAAAISEKAPGAGRLLERALLSVCVLALVGNLADLADYTSRLATLSLSLIVVCTAAWALVAGRANLARIWGGLIKGSSTPSATLG